MAYNGWFKGINVKFAKGQVIRKLKTHCNKTSAHLILFMQVKYNKNALVFKTESSLNTYIVNLT